MGEAELMSRFAAGEPGSAAEMYRDYGRLVYAVTHRLLGDAGLAEDATRSTFTRAWRLAGSFDPSIGLAPWLATIAGRAAIAVERANRQPRQSAASGSIPESELLGPAPPDEKIYDTWLVRRALDALSDQDRGLIRLHHLERLTPTEISGRLGIPLRDLKFRSHSAHRRFADLLGRLRAAGDILRPPDRQPPSRSRAGREDGGP
jgi:RNA polymerase sigma-70 factor (ECF subfamily)